jgi:hypothetical protein
VSHACLEAKELSDWVKADRSHHNHLDHHDKNNAPNEFEGAVLILNPAHKAWNKQHSACFHGETHCQEEGSSNRLVLSEQVQTDNNVHRKERVVEQVLVEFANLFVSEQEETNQLSSCRLLLEIAVSNLADEQLND